MDYENLNLNAFNSKPPKNPKQNLDALENICKSIELFELFNSSGLPTELFLEGGIANVLAFYNGLIINKEEIPDKIDNAFDLIKKITNKGYDCNAIHLIKRNEGKYEKSLHEKLKLENTSVIEKFCYDLTNFKSSILTFKVEPSLDFLKSLLQETSNWKKEKDYVWDFQNRTGKRVKYRSDSKGREGLIYLGWQMNYEDGITKYSCSCPAKIEMCKHVKLF